MDRSPAKPSCHSHHARSVRLTKKPPLLRTHRTHSGIYCARKHRRSARYRRVPISCRTAHSTLDFPLPPLDSLEGDRYRYRSPCTHSADVYARPPSPRTIVQRPLVYILREAGSHEIPPIYRYTALPSCRVTSRVVDKGRTNRKHDG